MRETHFSRMEHQQVTLGEFPHECVELKCWSCEREGVYRKGKLVDRFGAASGLVNVLNVLAADCPRNVKKETGKGCGAHYSNLPVYRPIDRPSRDPRAGRV